MTRNVGERQILRTQQLDWWAFEESVVLLADESSVLNGFMTDVVDVLCRRWIHYASVLIPGKKVKGTQSGAYGFSADDADVVCEWPGTVVMVSVRVTISTYRSTFY
jgi:hypothetical protein